MVHSATPSGDSPIIPQFQVERSTDLINWTPVSGVLTGVLNQKLVFTNQLGTIGFYRVTSVIDQEYAQMDNVTLDNGQLQFADFFGAELFGASLQFTTLTNASFAAADLENADLAGADLTGANLFAVVAPNTTFDDGSLAGATLALAILKLPACSMLT